MLFPGPPQNRLPTPQPIPKVRTVEELERMLINQSKTGNNNVPNNAPNNNQQFQQHGQVSAILRIYSLTILLKTCFLQLSVILTFSSPQEPKLDLKLIVKRFYI